MTVVSPVSAIFCIVTCLSLWVLPMTGENFPKFGFLCSTTAVFYAAEIFCRGGKDWTAAVAIASIFWASLATFFLMGTT